MTCLDSWSYRGELVLRLGRDYYATWKKVPGAQVGVSFGSRKRRNNMVANDKLKERLEFTTYSSVGCDSNAPESTYAVAKSSWQTELDS